jgi:hypothetical protein
MIPPRLIFIWFGRAFPYANLLALRSARRWFAPEEVLLITDEPDALRRKFKSAVTDSGTEILTQETIQMATEVLRGLTEKEVNLLSPEIKAYITGLQAQERLCRMVGLLVEDPEGVELDFNTMTLVRRVPDISPADDDASGD